MNIISGKYRGMSIKCPPGRIRPVMGRMRKSMFSILGDNIRGKIFLDLFSGSGIMALEAASRGASEIWLVENDRKKSKILYANLDIVKDIPVKICLVNVWNFVRKMPKSFDYIHLDPPFDFACKKELLQLLSTHSMINTSTILTLHCTKREKINCDIGNFICYDTRLFGQSCLAFYSKKFSN